ncbi:polysaccharide deacetylase family protein [Actinomarinicola tropica]|uniref:ChbG/HpnK family deacetylase n=1 Tax=Actinomarinicola tropica TaxID=2789776 RepID=A0A5Q2RKE2_9ACTN|nr:polysaccharide deacetylase family protein [Actinomarinicola tropica]QGG94330.1 ChbG/HpnK family deacetylase [Actinomarinicola tropica]
MTSSRRDTGPTLAERLGYRPDDRVVIVNCDDLGSSHAANDAIRRSMGDGAASSTTLMVPCPWAAHAAADPPGEDVGVHLTLTSEWDGYRWGPITPGASLLDAEGRMPRTIEEVWAQADLDEVRTELRAQVEQALRWGLDVTHLDSHMGTVQLDARYFDVYLELAVELDLPMRLSGWSSEKLIGFEFRQRTADAGVVAPDHLVGKDVLARAGDLRPGVTELYLHPATDTPELRALAPDNPRRIEDAAMLAPGGPLAETLERAGAHVISYRALRDLQRAG